MYYAGQKMQITAKGATTLMAVFAEAVEADEPRAVFEAQAGGRRQRHMAVVGKGIPMYLVVPLRW